ncbi:MAG: tetratricopeptide repeat protein [Paracoccaceae bacterium]
MRKLKWMGITVALGLLAACDNAGGFAARDGNPFAPTGFDQRQVSVDGLLVGHRLMAAGEYELALKAYLRAGGEQGLNVDVLSALGSANLKLGRLGQAETILRQAVKAEESFAPAWNNLGVVLMERSKFGEAERVFRTAFALDSGQSVEIRDNLRLALENLETPDYSEANNYNFALVRRGQGDYLLLSTPN